MERLATAILVFIIVSVSCTSVQGANSGPVSTRLTLPEPFLVNSFLKNNATNRTNPLFNTEDPRPLRVTKCQPKLGKLKNTFGPAYEFYQVEAPETGCTSPPPLETVVHHHHVGSAEYWAFSAWFYASLAFLVMNTAVLWPLFTVGAILERGWEAVPPEEPSEPDLEAPATEPKEVPQDGNESDQEAEEDLEADVEERARMMASRKHARLLDAYGLFGVAFVLLSAAFATHAAMKDIYPKTTIQRLGPVALPDPSKGLNQFLKQKDASLSLELCQTPKMSFYVGFPDSCERLGDPYGDIEASVKTGASKPTPALVAWLKAFGLLHLYFAGFCIVLLSVAGNVALILLLIGRCDSDQLKKVASALRLDLIRQKEMMVADMRK